MNWRVDSCNFRCLLQEMWKLPEVTHKPVGLNILNWMTWAHFSDMKNLPPSVCLIGLSNSSLLPFRRSLLIPLSLSLFGRIKAHPCHPIGQSGLTDSRVQLLDTGSCPRHHRWSSHAGPSEWQAPAEPFTPGAAEKKPPSSITGFHRRCRRTPHPLLLFSSPLLYLLFITQRLSLLTARPSFCFLIDSKYFLSFCVSLHLSTPLLDLL